MRQRKRLIGYAVFALFALASQVAIAQTPPAHAPPAREDRDQHVVFDDDLLDANLDTPFGDPVFSKHMPPARVTLIRPRTSFVPELYKSVEQI
jgi:hypothetical protein